MTMEEEFRNRHYIMLRSWKVVCLATSVFTLLSVDHEESFILIATGAFLIISTTILAVILIPRYVAASLPRISHPKPSIDFGLVWYQVEFCSL